MVFLDKKANNFVKSKNNVYPVDLRWIGNARNPFYGIQNV